MDFLASVRTIASEDIQDFLQRCAPELTARVAEYVAELLAYAWLYRLEGWMSPF